MGSRDWSNLQVSAATARFVAETGFKRMTPVQAIAIPLLINHRDVAVEACTGSGKTLAFLIPAVEILLRSDVEESHTKFKIGCVILSPTRELTGQIHEVLGSYLDAASKADASSGAKIGKQLIVGGTDAKATVDMIRRTEAHGTLQVVVATPGRITAIMEQMDKVSFNLKPLELLVLDEADRLLQLGFTSDIEKVLSAVPKQRRTGLFSATLTSELQRLMKTGMRNPVHVCVRLKKNDDSKPAVSDAPKTADEAGTGAKPAGSSLARARHELPTKLENFYAFVPAVEKLGFLLQFLETADVRQGKVIIFFSTCACVDFFHVVLRRLIDSKARVREKKRGRRGKPAPPSAGRITKLHGQMNQVARTKAYEEFTTSELERGSVLLATDLAARGIDVEAVRWIVQFDTPTDPTAFVHRIGRTARAGRSGRSLTMLLPHEDSYVPYLRQHGIPIEEMPKPENGSSSESGAALEQVKRLIETDRAVMIKANSAFVSFVRAYQEHQLPYVFPFKLLDLGALASGFCLLRLPRVKEILGQRVKGFTQSAVDPNTVPFKDKSQEKQRQGRLQEKVREVKEQREAKAVAATAKAEPERKRTRTQKRKAKKKEVKSEWQLLADEERLAKKVRRGQISSAQFQARVRKAARKVDTEQDEEDSSESDEADAGSDDGGDARWLVSRRQKRRKKKS